MFLPSSSETQSSSNLVLKDCRSEFQKFYNFTIFGSDVIVPEKLLGTTVTSRRTNELRFKETFVTNVCWLFGIIVVKVKYVF